ncbi:eCIS core domain-containing protein [Luteimonas saliphila]|uniref:eCIS core domain-containing protein n=1 Tax=Luteimonas saliphila TaxID=2804919 RepID=UPI00192D7FC5|nr:DUF4157 domain-containing protein [Luteimonas saliphila]
MSHVHAPVATTPASEARRVQRACQCGSCEKCRKKKVQRKAHADTAPAQALSPAAFESGGSPLPHVLRASLEPRFGTDFSAVRIHDDATSHRAARALHANAFTWGQHIHFGAGRYRPDHEHGLHLLAHELTHTVQQRGSAPVAATDAIEVDAPDTPLEREADAAADAVVAGHMASPRPITTATGLVQRDAIPGNAESDLPDGSGGGVRIRRTMREQPCDRARPVPRTESTPRDRIFEWDDEAHALRMRYTICRGRVRLSTRGEIDYSQVVDAGERLLETLRDDPSRGADLPELGRTAIDEARLSGTGEVTLTVDGILQATVGTDATGGTAGQEIRVRGQLKITPDGVSFTITGFVDASRTPTLSAEQYALNLRVGTRWFAINLGYTRDDRTPDGAATESRQRLRIGAEIPLPDIGPLRDLQLRPGVDIDLDTGTPGLAPGLVFEGRFGGPDRTPRVDCFECRCPPPLPAYTCTPYGTREVVDTPADTQRSTLLYDYDKALPADAIRFGEQADRVARLAGQGYAVRSLAGYASPEGTVAYNQALAQRRADHAHAEISGRLPAGATPLPTAIGVGELLGESSTVPGSEARNAQLTSELRGRLSALGPDERLELLGVDGERRDDPVQRQRALDDIDAFVQGRDARGRRIAGRARWELVFPFLRRVEVELHRDAATHLERVDRPEERGGCDPAQRAHIDREHPIPPAGRLPTRSCEEK